MNIALLTFITLSLTAHAQDTGTVLAQHCELLKIKHAAALSELERQVSPAVKFNADQLKKFYTTLSPKEKVAYEVTRTLRAIDHDPGVDPEVELPKAKAQMKAVGMKGESFNELTEIIDTEFFKTARSKIRNYSDSNVGCRWFRVAGYYDLVTCCDSKKKTAGVSDFVACTSLDLLSGNMRGETALEALGHPSATLASQKISVKKKLPPALDFNYVGATDFLELRKKCNLTDVVRIKTADDYDPKILKSFGIQHPKVESTKDDKRAVDIY